MHIRDENGYKRDKLGKGEKSGLKLVFKISQEKKGELI